MIPQTLYVSRFTAWAPGFTGLGDWQAWAAGTRGIPKSPESPALDFQAPQGTSLSPQEIKRFKGRLSQISKMTIQVVHDLLPQGKDLPLSFLSFRGEITRQCQLNLMLLQEGDVSPTAFSLSVFNTPPAAAAIVLNLTAGYSALYPAKNQFAQGFLAGASGVLCGDQEETLLVYGDELGPPEYEGLGEAEPLCFGILLSRKPSEAAIPVPLIPQVLPALESPQDFLRYLYASS